MAFSVSPCLAYKPASAECRDGFCGSDCAACSSRGRASAALLSDASSRPRLDCVPGEYLRVGRLQGQHLAEVGFGVRLLPGVLLQDGQIVQGRRLCRTQGGRGGKVRHRLVILFKRTVNLAPRDEGVKLVRAARRQRTRQRVQSVRVLPGFGIQEARVEPRHVVFRVEFGGFAERGGGRHGFTSLVERHTEVLVALCGRRDGQQVLERGGGFVAVPCLPQREGEARQRTGVFGSLCQHGAELRRRQVKLARLHIGLRQIFVCACVVGHQFDDCFHLAHSVRAPVLPQIDVAEHGVGRRVAGGLFGNVREFGGGGIQVPGLYVRKGFLQGVAIRIVIGRHNGNVGRGRAGFARYGVSAGIGGSTAGVTGLRTGPNVAVVGRAAVL